MGSFGADPRKFFDGIYEQTPPWDVGRPQPALSALLIEYPPADPILDVGCGSGDLAIHLAGLGHEVVGVDFVEAAIAVACRKANGMEGKGRVDFRVADALRPSRLGQRFGAIVDSGFHHLFDPETDDAFADDLPAALIHRGRYYLLGFATEFPMPNTPRALSEAELSNRFSEDRGWKTLALRSAMFESNRAPVPAIGACFEYTGGEKS